MNEPTQNTSQNKQSGDLSKDHPKLGDMNTTTELPKDVEERFDTGFKELNNQIPKVVDAFKLFLAQELSSAVQKERERIIKESKSSRASEAKDVNDSEYEPSWVNAFNQGMERVERIVLTPQPKGEERKVFVSVTLLGRCFLRRQEPM